MSDAEVLELIPASWVAKDVERQEDGPALKDGVSRDRVPSAHDPEMRHGRKSSSKRFDGHKAAVVVDTDSQLVTAVDILPGNAGRSLGTGPELGLRTAAQHYPPVGQVVQEGHALGDVKWMVIG